MVLVGLGSNQGESTEIVVAAIEALVSFAQPSSLRASQMFRTSPVNCPPGSGDFVNAAVTFEAKRVWRQKSCCRRSRPLNESLAAPKIPAQRARELDLDLLLFNDETRDSEVFTLPHPRAVDRLFVLKPAAQLVPDVIWPGLGKTIACLLDRLKTDEEVHALEGVLLIAALLASSPTQAYQPELHQQLTFLSAKQVSRCLPIGKKPMRPWR